MEQAERKDNRLLSGLVDLKVEHIGSDKVVEEGRRKSKKGNALRAIYDDHIYQNFLEIAQKKTTADKAIILKSLKGHFTFSALIEEPDLKELLLEKFKLCKVLEGQYLMKQGNSASSFFILHEGKLTVQINGVVKRHIEPGEGFGELALLYSAPRSASIKAVKSSFLWYIDRQTFRTALASMITKNYKENRLFIEKNPFFKYLTSSQKDRLASVAISQRFQKGKDICKEGELAASMYILKSGKLTKHKGNEFKGVVTKGESFEEYTSLSKGCLRRLTIKVAEDAQVIALGVEDIQNALGRSLPLIILRNEAKNALKASKVMEKLNEEYLEKVIDCFKLKNVKAGQVLARKEDVCQNLLFFVAEGQYMISDSSKRSKLYGQSAFLDHTSTFRCEIKMKEAGKIAWTTLQEVVKAFGCSLDEAYKNSETISKALEAQRHVKLSLAEIGKKLSLEDFLVVKKLGEGQFGHVFLVTDPSKERFFALKTISKQDTIKSKLQKHLSNERQALSLISSPFVMEFVRSYKDENYLYFLTEFINGIELFDAIRLIGLLNSEQTIFYAAQLLHIIEVMHQKSLIYRDLKPENVMVCSDGYLKLIDLGTCKKMNGNEKTFTMIGTPNYMAPETLAGKGYSFPADLWSLGIMLFEFMAGYVPYGEDAEDPLQIYQEILKNPLKFPKSMKDTNINGFISLLLCKNPQTRLGGSFSNLKKHLVFSQIQWHEIIGKNMKPLFIIPQQKLLDLSHFKNKLQHLNDVLKAPNKVVLTRKDYDPNWDAIF